ncbi:putative acyltransferase, partial [Zymoseptoria tritici IPO323]
TAYLDGMRGLVALLVFVRHFSLPWQPHLDYGYGQYGSYHGLLRLPFLRILFAGPWVPMMFVVSGYVLSAKPLKLARNEAWQGLFLSMASSTFRRAIRLFLPPVVSTCAVMLIVHLGGFSFDYELMPGRNPEHPAALDSVGAQLGDWCHFVLYELTNPWDWHQRQLMAYGPHLWTIPIAFQGTLVVFLACLGLARTRPRMRAVSLGLGIVWSELCGRKYIAPFLGGTLIRELSFSKQAASGPGGAKEHTTGSMVRSSFAYIGLMFGLFLGSFPRFNDHGRACTFGWKLLCDITPNYRFWHGIAAFCVLLAIDQDRTLQRPFEHRIIQYMGTISFSFYIVHEPFLHVVAFYLPGFFWTWIGQEGWLRYQCGFAMGMLASLFILVWIADVF